MQAAAGKNVSIQRIASGQQVNSRAMHFARQLTVVFILVFPPGSIRHFPLRREMADAAWWEHQYKNDGKLTGEMHRAGVHLLAGSDSLDRYVFPGSSLHYELTELVAAGLTPQEALQTATE